MCVPGSTPVSKMATIVPRPSYVGLSLIGEQAMHDCKLQCMCLKSGASDVGVRACSSACWVVRCVIVMSALHLCDDKLNSPLERTGH